MKNIHLWGVKQNNLKNIDVKIPLGSITVICGPSGSGKSSLAFETLFAEGQRRFIESLSHYARQFLNAAPKPEIEGVSNIPPAISIAQNNSVKNSRSTVGTTTEIIDYLRLLFEKLGTSYCPTHHIPTSKESPTEATQKVLSQFKGERGYLLVEVPKIGRPLKDKELHAFLLKEGFLRIMIPPKNKPSKLGEIKEISTPEAIKKGLPKDLFYIIVDRLIFDVQDEGRITDSMTLAYETSLKFNTSLSVAKTMVLTVDGKQLLLSELNSCSICGYQPPHISTKLFSFNSPYGACPTCKGFGNILELDEKKIIPNPLLSIKDDVLHPFSVPSAQREYQALLLFCKRNKINIHTPWVELPVEQRDLIWNGADNFLGVVGLFKMLEEIKYKMHVRVFIARYRSPKKCSDCQGSRLRIDTQYIFFRNHTLPQLSAMTVSDLSQFFINLKPTQNEINIANEILAQINSRLNFLLRVGVHYLNLNRETRTLSGGEFQRLILAHQLGMSLSQTLFVLDEPTVGLHPRDNDRLISILNDLKNLGNTLVIVEHDQDVISSSENIIELGPGSGIFGGHILFSGSIKDFWKDKNSVTVPFLKPHSRLSSSEENEITRTFSSKKSIEISRYKYKITLEGATGHNLKSIDVQIPLHCFVTVTGVSGSGKSTLITQTLYPLLARALNQEYLISQPCKEISGYEHIKQVVLLDQSAIGRSLRSNIVTYMKIYDSIRNLLSQASKENRVPIPPGHFSLNIDGGRCPNCKGLGSQEVDMVFMDNVILKCELCDGKRFQDEVLEVKFQGKNIIEIFDLTVEESLSFFVNYPNIRRSLSFLKQVGLEYIKLGQSASSFSGGESQRLKIAKELSQVKQNSTLYILDEPTTGLHFREIELLLEVLRKLIDTGGSVLVIEHNLNVITNSDYIIDLGPDGGPMGGQVNYAGPTNQLISKSSGLTAKYLDKFLKF